MTSIYKRADMCSDKCPFKKHKLTLAGIEYSMCTAYGGCVYADLAGGNK